MAAAGPGSTAAPAAWPTCGRRGASGCASPASTTTSPSWPRNGTWAWWTRCWASARTWPWRLARCGRPRPGWPRASAARPSAGERLEWLAEQLGDLDKLAPRPGEWAQLRAEREPLRHAVHLEQAFREGAEALDQAGRHVEAGPPGPGPGRRDPPRRPGGRGPPALRGPGTGGSPGPGPGPGPPLVPGGADRIEALEARLALYERLARRHRCEPEELPARCGH